MVYSEGLKEWWDSLFAKGLRIYPRFTRNGEQAGFFNSPQCTGCFAVMSPNDSVVVWMRIHFEHRNIVDPFYKLTDKEKAEIAQIPLK
jgi:hypothetical protein